jgi:hydroxyethylthiazole kinase-like sugar kinase family protein
MRTITGCGANAGAIVATPLSHPTDEELTRRLVRRDGVTDLAAQRLVELGEFQQCLGMDADLIVDDELQSRQPDPGVRYPRERKADPGFRRSS